MLGRRMERQFLRARKLLDIPGQTNVKHILNSHEEGKIPHLTYFPITVYWLLRLPRTRIILA